MEENRRSHDDGWDEWCISLNPLTFTGEPSKAKLHFKFSTEQHVCLQVTVHGQARLVQDDRPPFALCKVRCQHPVLGNSFL